MVVEDGTVTGLRFGTPRESSGVLTDEELQQPALTGLDEHSKELARNWLERLQTQFSRDLVDELDSVRLTEELLRRWPEQAADAEARVAALRQRTTEFQQQVRRSQANPLRYAEFIETVPDEVAAIEREVDALTRGLQRLPDELDVERRAIIAARRHDAELLRRQLTCEQIDANVLTAYLLEEQLAGPVRDLLGWLRWARQIVPAESTPVVGSHRRRHDVVFRGCRPQPHVVVRSLDLAGVARLGGQSIELAGTLTDASSDPAHHDRPTRLRLSSHGTAPFDLQAVIDRTGPVARDQLLVDCGGILIPELQLGSADALRCSLAPTTASLNVSITVEGDRLSGEIQFIEQQAEIKPQVGRELEQLQLTPALNELLRRRQAIAIRVSLGGTLAEPQWQIWSNLGPTFAEAVDQALRRTASTRAGRLLADSQQRIDEQLAQVDRQIAERQTALLPKLLESHAALDTLATNYRRNSRLSHEYLGRRLPANSLFR
jgi:uncharacterized protein (TIGR03545 family)